MTTNVVTISSYTPIMEARRTMEFHGIERLPVVDRGKLTGIVTKSNLLKASASDVTVEEAVATAQTNRVGSLPVLENNLLVGILTTNDFFYKILNPILGIGEGGSRIIIYEAGQADSICKVMECIAHLDTEDPTSILNELKSQGFRAEGRKFLKKR
jgi:acetoin utilization protein AcuB